MANCKITQTQAEHIKQLVTEQGLKLREVGERFSEYAVLSLVQVHRIAKGKQWGRVTSSPEQQSSASLEKADG